MNPAFKYRAFVRNNLIIKMPIIQVLHNFSTYVYYKTRRCIGTAYNVY